MKITVPAGKYVVAVSGGVDSVVLLDLLMKLPGLDLVVAHFDHGMRADSEADRRFVERIAAASGVDFRYEQVRLGPSASEAQAREARYTFLRRLKEEVGAQAIITAHHQDDVLETAILNLIRGTGRKGLSSLKSTKEILRPLLSVKKVDIVNYAQKQHLEWHEDSTNQDPKYLRNYIRHDIVPNFDETSRQKLLDLIASTREINQELDGLLEQELLAHHPAGLDRGRFTGLPHAVSKELLAAWLRANGLREFDAPMLERLTVAAKTGRPGSRADIYNKVSLLIGKDDLALNTIER